MLNHYIASTGSCLASAPISLYLIEVLFQHSDMTSGKHSIAVD